MRRGYKKGVEKRIKWEENTARKNIMEVFGGDKLGRGLWVTVNMDYHVEDLIKVTDG